jgi:SepF-like predicted cell division protein (DUF552 family)
MTFDQHNYLASGHNSLLADGECMQKTPIYLKAVTLKSISDISNIKDDAEKQMILILRVTPLAHKDVEELRKAIDDLYKYVQASGGDIARLGEERVVITPPNVKIWKGISTI